MGDGKIRQALNKECAKRWSFHLSEIQSVHKIFFNDSPLSYLNEIFNSLNQILIAQMILYFRVSRFLIDHSG